MVCEAPRVGPHRDAMRARIAEIAGLSPERVAIKATTSEKMGFTGREPPFFFLKPADAIVVVNAGETGQLPYPSLTANLHHEIELVVAIGKGGKNIQAADAFSHIYGYAVGLDMTRRDLQNDMKKQGRPWCIGKGFDASAPIGPITPAAQAGDVANAPIWLQVNGADRRRSLHRRRRAGQPAARTPRAANARRPSGRSSRACARRTPGRAVDLGAGCAAGTAAA